MNEVDFETLCKSLTERLIIAHKQRGQRIDSKASGFQQIVLGGLETSKRHYDFDNQMEALKVVPIDEIHQAADALVREKQYSFQNGLVIALLDWFKTKFFRWVDTLECDTCKVKTRAAGGAAPTPEESRSGAGRVEIHQCDTCKSQYRFPRYNDPKKLLQTRQGRCGEWANCFCLSNLANILMTLVSAAMGITTRYVIDWNDHVWTEVFIDDRW
jgi:peptide-N4-(N-acetyl-beta-glucosaminyl)asparagine amidase